MINSKNLESKNNDSSKEIKNNNDVEKNINKNIFFENNKLEQDLIELKNCFLKNKILYEQEINKVQIRIEKNIELIHKFSLEKIIFSLLPVIDSLERAIELSDVSNLEIKNTCDKIKQILKNFIKLLKSFNVKIINEINIPFDPTIHQAMSLIKSKEIQENYVVNIVQKGYILFNRLLRPAMVIVSKN